MRMWFIGLGLLGWYNLACVPVVNEGEAVDHVVCVGGGVVHGGHTLRHLACLGLHHGVEEHTGLQMFTIADKRVSGRSTLSGLGTDIRRSQHTAVWVPL